MISYLAPRADTEFEDVSYDGDLGRSFMTGGLGMLTDSLYGADDFLQFDLQFHKPLSKCEKSFDDTRTISERKKNPKKLRSPNGFELISNIFMEINSKYFCARIVKS